MWPPGALAVVTRRIATATPLTSLLHAASDSPFTLGRTRTPPPLLRIGSDHRTLRPFLISFSPPPHDCARLGSPAPARSRRDSVANSVIGSRTLGSLMTAATTTTVVVPGTHLMTALVGPPRPVPAPNRAGVPQGVDHGARQRGARRRRRHAGSRRRLAAVRGTGDPAPDGPDPRRRHAGPDLHDAAGRREPR